MCFVAILLDWCEILFWPIWRRASLFEKGCREKISLSERLLKGLRHQVQGNPQNLCSPWRSFCLGDLPCSPIKWGQFAVTHVNLIGRVMASGNRISGIHLKPDELENINSYWTQISWRAQQDHQASCLMYAKKIQSKFLFKGINPALL